jgi:hypothetical protein
MSSRRKRSKHRLRTIRRIPDELWAELQPLLPPEKPPGTPGRPVVPVRQVLDGVLYVLRTGCQWKALPRKYGSGSTCHRGTPRSITCRRRSSSGGPHGASPWPTDAIEAKCSPKQVARMPYKRFCETGRHRDTPGGR